MGKGSYLGWLPVLSDWRGLAGVNKLVDRYMGGEGFLVTLAGCAE